MADSNPITAEAEVDFEAALKALEDLVKQMESGELGLEASLAAFERGVKLTRQCQAALKQAELRVRTLTEDNELEDLDLGPLNDA
ncbi:MAG: exodeoxyribonuclease VII small subunit [Gammaproteobacteria bacterium]|nr:exodeoxyribonuclease VII small subunit [Gammaproteobacteria bacterium]